MILAWRRTRRRTATACTAMPRGSRASRAQNRIPTETLNQTLKQTLKHSLKQIPTRDSRSSPAPNPRGRISTRDSRSSPAPNQRGRSQPETLIVHPRPTSVSEAFASQCTRACVVGPSTTRAYAMPSQWNVERAYFSGSHTQATHSRMGFSNRPRQDKRRHFMVESRYCTRLLVEEAGAVERFSTCAEE